MESNVEGHPVRHSDSLYQARSSPTRAKWRVSWTQKRAIWRTRHSSKQLTFLGQNYCVKVRIMPFEPLIMPP